MPNRLGGETSPYLLQHAGNPVDWYPWGDAASARARAEDRPLFVSIGYAACHWCHVMERESFEDVATAQVINDRFVPVKVDREERPEVDAVYMEATQLLTGGGGWPMSVFCTPDGYPFFAGTYFPPRQTRSAPSFTSVLLAVDEAWRLRRAEVLEQAAFVHQNIAEQLSPRLPSPRGDRGVAPRGADRPTGGRPGNGVVLTSAHGRPVPSQRGERDGGPSAPPGAEEEFLERATAAVTAAFDPVAGGFGRAPKFPHAEMIELLLRAGERSQGGPTSAMAAATLDAMAAGGIYDQIGGGFARYSVDRGWLVPHFEKMLYDQALLVSAYVHSWQATGTAEHLRVAQETVDYVLRDLAADGGGLCSSEDADSDGGEGRFYTWTPGELVEALGAARGAEMAGIFGVTPAGNFEGRSILHRAGAEDRACAEDVRRACEELRHHREQRPRPARDTKVLTEWNAMFLSSLCEAAGATGRRDWRVAAVDLGTFLVRELRRDDGRWMRSRQAGAARHLAYAADYAWLVEAFTRLGELTGTARWTDEAQGVADAMLDLFCLGPDDGVLYTTGRDAEQIIVRSREMADGAVPSASAVAAGALLRLAALTSRSDFGAAAQATVEQLLPFMANHPQRFLRMARAVELRVFGTREITVAGQREDLVATVQRRWLPDAVLAWGEPTASPLFQGVRDGYAYVCENRVCAAPVGDPGALARLIDDRVVTPRRGPAFYDG